MPRWWRRLQCRMQGGHRWQKWNRHGLGALNLTRNPYPPISGDVGVVCIDCGLTYVPCTCFFCAGRPLHEVHLERLRGGRRELLMGPRAVFQMSREMAEDIRHVESGGYLNP